MRLLLALPIILLPNTAHLPSDVSVGVSAAILVLVALLHRRDPADIRRPARMMPPLLALFLAMVVGFLAAQWHDLAHFEKDIREAKVAVLFPLLYIVYLRSGLSLKHTRQLIVLVLVVAVVAGLEAVYQGLSFNLGEFSETQRATGPFGQIKQANRAGVFFAMYLPMVFALALQPRQKRWVQILALAGTGILALAIMFTYSRQSYLIGLFTIMVLLVWRSIPAAVLAGLVLVATATTILPGSVVDRVQETQQVDSSGAVVFDVSTTSRFTIWNGTLDMLQDHPAGVGLGRFADHIGDYTSYQGKDAHNGFLLTLAELGPLGLMALLWVFWRLWVMSGWLRRSPAAARPETGTFERGFTMVVVALALGNMYGSPFFDSLIMSSFWILCGLMERYGMLKYHAADVVAAHTLSMRDEVPLGIVYPLAGRALPRLANPNHPGAR
jgi:hypothetical protein